MTNELKKVAVQEAFKLMKRGAVKQSLEQFGMRPDKIDFSHTFMEAVEFLCYHVFQMEKLPDIAKYELALNAGYCLGETICSLIPGAEWANDGTEEDFEDVKMLIPARGGATQEFYPFSRALGFWENQEEAMVVALDMIIMNATVDIREFIKDKTPDKDGYYHLPNGYAFKLTQMNAGASE